MLKQGVRVMDELSNYKEISLLKIEDDISSILSRHSSPQDRVVFDYWYSKLKEVGKELDKRTINYCEEY